MRHDRVTPIMCDGIPQFVLYLAQGAIVNPIRDIIY
jgi:hypothetical protein